MIGKISEDLKAASDYLLDDVAVPKNASLNGAEVLAGGTNGALEVVLVAKTDIALTNAKVLTVKLFGADEKGGTYTLMNDLHSTTAAGATTIAAGTVMGRYLINTADKNYCRATVTTDDAAVTGTIDCYIKMVA